MGPLGSFPMSQPLWSRHAAAVREAQRLLNSPVQVPEPAAPFDVHLYSEPPLSPEEEEALAASAAPRVVQGALF